MLADHAYGTAGVWTDCGGVEAVCIVCYASVIPGPLGVVAWSALGQHGFLVLGAGRRFAMVFMRLRCDRLWKGVEDR